MLEVALNKLSELIRRQVHALEAVGLKKFARLRQLQNLGHVGVNFSNELRRHIRRPPHREPAGGREAGYSLLGYCLQIRTQFSALRPGCCDNSDFAISL